MQRAVLRSGAARGRPRYVGAVNSLTVGDLEVGLTRNASSAARNFRPRCTVPAGVVGLVASGQSPTLSVLGVLLLVGTGGGGLLLGGLLPARGPASEVIGGGGKPVRERPPLLRGHTPLPRAPRVPFRSDRRRPQPTPGLRRCPRSRRVVAERCPRGPARFRASTPRVQSVATHSRFRPISPERGIRSESPESGDVSSPAWRRRWQWHASPLGIQQWIDMGEPARERCRTNPQPKGDPP
jgi:hypothetical protein